MDRKTDKHNKNIILTVFWSFFSIRLFDLIGFFFQIIQNFLQQRTERQTERQTHTIVDKDKETKYNYFLEFLLYPSV